MSFRILLSCPVLCCAALRCAVLSCAALRCAVLCCAVLCCAVLCYAALRCAVLCCAVLRCVYVALHCLVLDRVVLYCVLIQVAVLTVTDTRYNYAFCLQILRYFDYVFTGIFLLEVLLKVNAIFLTQPTPTCLKLLGQTLKTRGRDSTA